MRLFDKSLKEAEDYLEPINTNNNVALQQLVESLIEVVSNMLNEINQQMQDKGCNICKPLSDNIEGGKRKEVYIHKKIKTNQFLL